jgi:hypothetical protein
MSRESPRRFHSLNSIALAGLVVLALGAGLVVALQPGARPIVDAGIARLRSLTRGSRDYRQAPPPALVTVSVNARQPLHKISPLIYGVSVASQTELEATGARLNRWGGNPNTRYNWALGSAWNAARDWEFRNYGGTPVAPSATSDEFVAKNRAVNVQSVITIPAIGWVARSSDTESRSTNVPPAGGPPLSSGADAILGYDPTLNRTVTSVPSFARKGAPFTDVPNIDGGPVFQDEWVHHLVGRFGAASAGGVRYYVVDNEPDLWSATHTDVHPVDSSYDDMLATFIEYANAIKSVDPQAQVLGPAVSGWTGYFFSARDRGSDNFRTHADRQAHADMPFLAWWLNAVRQHDEQVGRRTIDVLDVHYYPQAPSVFSDAHDEATNLVRLRSTRSLWDPTYVDESWIDQPVRLIPRLREWIDRYYPGTLLAVNEWNWGADQTMNGALAIADVLGIFGREGVDMAAYWTSPPAGSPGAFAFSLYTNYDGFGRGFGDQALAVSSDHPDDVAAYASRDSATGALIVVALNQRSDADLPVRLGFDDTSGFQQVRAYRYSAQQPEAIERLDDLPMTSQSVALTLPAASITLLQLD